MLGGGPSELTAQEFNKKIINEVLKGKKKEEGSAEDQKILDQLPQCPLHPIKMSNLKCRKCKKIKAQFDRLKGNDPDEDYYSGKPKQIDLDQIAEEWLKSNESEGLPIHGDPSKGNINDLLRANIMRCQYFKIDLYELKTYHEVMNEIDIHVGYVEPWTIGTHGVPSTLFCCLYKLMLMRLTLKQIFGLIKEGNAFSRCCGFLYIRYLCKPELLWHFLSPFMLDEQKFVPTPATGEEITIGEYVEKLLTEQNYYTTILPRIPALIDKEIQKRILLIPDKRMRKRENLDHINEFVPDNPIYFLDNTKGEWVKAICSEVLPEGVKVLYKTDSGEDTIKAVDFSEVLPCYDEESEDDHYSSDRSYDRDKDRERRHRKKSKKSRKRSRSRDRDRSDSNGRRRKRHREDKHSRSYRKRDRKIDLKELEEEVRQRRMNQASSSTRAGYSKKATSYKTTMSLAMPVGIKNRNSRSPTPEREFVEIENKAKNRKTEKILTIDEDEIERQNKQQNERLERLKKLYQN